MKKALSLTMVLALALVALPALAGEQEAKEVELTGWITDQYCGAKNANAENVDCIKACAEKGSALMVYADGELYKISNKEMALQHVGYKVVVKGTIDEDNVVTPSSIEKAEEA